MLLKPHFRLESNHGRKLQASGDFSLKGFFREQVKYFTNFPLDGEGHPVPLNDFTSMPMHHLLIWRDHLISSFSSKPKKRPFQFKIPSSKLPLLTPLKMGSNQALLPLRKGRVLGGKKQASRSTKKSKKQAAKVSEEESSMSSGDETYEEDMEDAAADLPPRSRGRRQSGVKASKKIGKLIQLDEEVEREATSGKKKTKSVPSRPKSLPGSVEQQLKKKAEVASGNVEPKMDEKGVDDKSMFFQVRDGMGPGKLPKSWKDKDYKSDSVSLIFPIIKQAQFFTL